MATAAPPASVPFLTQPLFVGRVTGVVAHPLYTFTESWLATGDTLSDKTAGRFGGAGNPGVSVLGKVFSVGEPVLARQADGAGGLRWELFSLDAAYEPSASGSSGAGGATRLVGSGVSDVLCVGGVVQVWKRDEFQDQFGRVTQGASHFAYAAGCCECGGSGSSSGSGSGGSGSGGGGGTTIPTACCPDPFGIPTTIYLTLSGGNGVVTMAFDSGSNKWVGDKVIGPCTVRFEWDTLCVLKYRCSPSGTPVVSGCTGDDPEVGCTYNCNPFSVTTGTFTFNSASLTGCGCDFGSLTGTLSA